jgi:hypothetical protein
MTCWIALHNSDLMDSRVLRWKLVPWQRVTGKQTACVLMLTDKPAEDPRKLTLSFFTPEGVSYPGSQNLCLGDDKDWHKPVTDLLHIHLEAKN